jgi:hypothetical protein
MVNKKINMSKAIAMVELVFALVIMGIVLMSAPMLISTVSKSINVALQQEGINEAASRLGIILTHEWDENNVNVPCEGTPSILHTTSPVTALEEYNNTQLRIGVPPTSNSHTYDCNGNEYNATAIGSEDGYYNDIDDFDGSSALVEVTASGTGGKNYIETDTVQISTTVQYAADAGSNPNYNSKSITYVPSTASSTTSNIKLISTTLTSTSSAEELNQKQITLRTFSCNLGSYNYTSENLP